MANPVPVSYSSPEPPIAGGLFLTPSWVPPPGFMADVPEANTFLSVKPIQTHKLSSAAAPVQISNFHWETIINDFSGGAYNPYWSPSGGDFGCMLFYGGGHSATNFNGIVAFDFSTRQYSVVYLGTPGENMYPIDLMTATYSDGQPGASHTYDMLDVLGPSAGYPKGALAIPAQHAAFSTESVTSSTSFVFDFANQGAGWQMKHAQTEYGSWGAGGAAAWDSANNRVYWIHAGNNDWRLWWLDLPKSQMVIKSLDIGYTRSWASDNHQIMRFDHERNVLIVADVNAYDSLSRNIYWMDVMDPSTLKRWNKATVTSDFGSGPFGALMMAKDTHQGVWCCISNQQQGFVQYLRLPENLSDPWVFTKRPIAFAGGYSPSLSVGVTGRRWSYIPSLRSFALKTRADQPMRLYTPEAI